MQGDDDDSGLDSAHLRVLVTVLLAVVGVLVVLAALVVVRDNQLTAELAALLLPGA